MAFGWSPFGSNSDLMTRRSGRLRIFPGAAADAASTLGRSPLHRRIPGRPSRKQSFQRLLAGHGGDAASDCSPQPGARQVGISAASVFRIARPLRGRAGEVRRRGLRGAASPPAATPPHKGEGRSARPVPSSMRFERRIEPGDRRGGVIALRRLLETSCLYFGRRLARLVRGGKIRAAVERIVRRRLQSGAPEPSPAVPLLIAGLSRSASASGVAGSTGRAALARVGRAGSFGFFGEASPSAPNMGRVRRRGKGSLSPPLAGC